MANYGTYDNPRSTRDLIVPAWLNGQTMRGTALTCDEVAIRSYSLILAFRDNQGIWLLESVKGISVTTSKHYSGVAGNFARYGYQPDGEYTIRESGYPVWRMGDGANRSKAKYIRMVKVGN